MTGMTSRGTRRPSAPLVLVSLTILLMLVHGCATLRPRSPLPEALESQVEVPGFPGVRAWGDEISENLTKSARDSIRQERAACGEAVYKKPVTLLALSGGGSDGAFGVGVLYGWTEHGDRPEFNLVTGISTGALIAPFAFLGPQYDALLKGCCTSARTKDILKMKSLLTILWREALADSQPLANLVAKQVDAKVLAAIARDHAKGRRLFIGTTQLDAQRLVIWDMGAIAAKGTREALDLFRKILVASASIPGAFPPQYIKVTVGGRMYQEMQVDGGTTAEVILYEGALKPFARLRKAAKHEMRPRFLYIIRNSQVSGEWAKVKSRITSIGPRAISTLIKAQGVGDLYRLYVFARRDYMDYNVAAIPEDFKAAKKEEFDPVYMTKLFNLGYEMARKGFPWEKYPPFFEPEAILRTQEQERSGMRPGGSRPD
jgi:predicted patatin/cPLA2 family phospholipase